MNTSLVGMKCRPAANNGPPPSTAREEDYFYTVVAAWTNFTLTGKVTLVCALVSQEFGSTNVLNFMELEFWTPAE